MFILIFLYKRLNIILFINYLIIVCFFRTTNTYLNGDDEGITELDNTIDESEIVQTINELMELKVFHDKLHFESNDLVYDFIEKIVNEEGGIYRKQQPKEEFESKNSSEKETSDHVMRNDAIEEEIEEKELATEETHVEIGRNDLFTTIDIDNQTPTIEEIKNYYKEVIKNVFTSESINETKEKSKRNIYDFENNKAKYLLDYLDKKAETILEEFWKTIVIKKIIIHQIEKNFEEFYRKHNPDLKQNIFFQYLLFKFPCFLVNKYNSADETESKDKIYDIIIHFCEQIKLLNCFMPNKDNPKMKSSETTEKCLLSPANKKKLENLHYAIDLHMIFCFSGEVSNFIEDLQKKFIERKENIINDFPEMYLFENNILFSIIFQKTKNSVKMLGGLEIFFKDNEDLYKIFLIKSIATNIYTYRVLFTLFIISFKSVQDFIKINDVDSYYDKAIVFTNIYYNFISFSCVFSAIDFLMPCGLRDLCLDASSILLKQFYLGCYQDISLQERDLHSERKKNFKKVKYNLINQFVLKCEAKLENICMKLTPQVSIEQNYDHLFCFNSILIAFRADVQQVFFLNFFSFQNAFPDHVQDLQQENFVFNQNYFVKIKNKENMPGAQVEIPESNFEEFFKKIQKSCNENASYPIFVLLNALLDARQESLLILKDFKNFNSQLLTSKTYDREDVLKLMKRTIDFKNLLSPKIEVMDFIVMDFEPRKFMLYDKLLTYKKKLYKNETNFNVENLCVLETLGFLNDSSIAYEFINLFYLDFVFERIESSISSSFLIKKLSSFLSGISESNLFIYLSILWTIMLENLENLLINSQFTENAIEDFQKTNPIVFVEEVYLSTKNRTLLMVLISDIEIKISKTFQNANCDDRNIIKTGFFIDIEQSEDEEFWKETVDIKEHKEPIKLYLKRNKDDSYFENLILSINNILQSN